jgi:hypothetical protein
MSGGGNAHTADQESFVPDQSYRLPSSVSLIQSGPRVATIVPQDYERKVRVMKPVDTGVQEGVVSGAASQVRNEKVERMVVAGPNVKAAAEQRRVHIPRFICDVDGCFSTFTTKVKLERESFIQT